MIVKQKLVLGEMPHIMSNAFDISV